MIRSQITSSSARSRTFAPVFLPIAALIALTGISAVGRSVRQAFDGNHSLADSQQLAQHDATFNSTETTFAEYERVGELVVAGKDDEALARLQKLNNAPICVDGDSFHAQPLLGYSPRSLMLGLSNTLVIRANQMAAIGDTRRAHEYVRSLYAIGDSLLESSTPTISGVMLAHRFNSTAAIADAQLSNSISSASADSKKSLVVALNSMWKTRFAPQLHENLSQGASTNNKLAALISSEYEDEWSRIRAGEA